MREKEVPSGVYRATRVLCSSFFCLYNRISATGREQIPTSGGCLVACNHVSYLDPPAVASVVKHRVFRFMARDTLWKSRFMKWFLGEMRCIPIDRERGDLSAMRGVLKALKAGDLVALFPEGTRSTDGQLKGTKPGIGFIVAKAGVPIVPAYVDGTFRAYPKGAGWVRPAKVQVRFGDAILPADLPTIEQAKPCYEEISAFIMKRIGDLAPSR